MPKGEFVMSKGNRKRMMPLCSLLLVAAVIMAGCGGGSAPASSAAAPASNSAGPTGDGAVSETAGEYADLPDVTLKLANVVAVGTGEDLQSIMMAKIVSERTGGKLTIDVYSGGTLGGSKDTIEGLKTGIADIVIDSFAYLDSYSTATWCGFETAGFVYRDYDQYMEYWSSNGGGDKLLKRLEDETTFIVFGCAMDGARHITSKKRINSPEDLAGVKMRTPATQINVGFWEAMGANPTPMDFSEVYTALQQGMVDAQENPLSTSYNAAMYEICPYLTLSGHAILTDAMMMDKDKFYSLPQQYQDVLMEAAAESAVWRTNDTIQAEQNLLAQFKENGVEVIDNMDLTPWKERADSFHASLDQAVQDIIAEVKATYQ